jgi:hypothetical protein
MTIYPILYKCRVCKILQFYTGGELDCGLVNLTPCGLVDG